MEDLFGINYKKVLAEHGPEYASKFIRAAKSLKYLNETYGITVLHLEAQQSNLDSIWAFREPNNAYLKDVNLMHWGETSNEQDAELLKNDSAHFKIIEHFIELFNVTDYTLQQYNDSEFRDFYIVINIIDNHINIVADWDLVTIQHEDRSFDLC